MIQSVSGRPSSKLGLASHPRQNERLIARAFAGGVNFFFMYGPGQRAFNRGLGKLFRKHRDEVVIATGCGGRAERSMLNSRKKLIAALNTQFFDIFFAEYVSSMDDADAVFGDGGTLDVLQQWKADGWIRYVGATTHDRKLAVNLAQDPRVDVLMHRFNMAHRKAATEVFPTAIRTKTPVVAFTATRWGTLLASPNGSSQPAPSAADCYRYCLAHRAVRIVLTAPRTLSELNENLSVLHHPAMTLRERRRWEKFGEMVYGTGKDAFETQWT